MRNYYFLLIITLTIFMWSGTLFADEVVFEEKAIFEEHAVEEKTVFEDSTNCRGGQRIF